MWSLRNDVCSAQDPSRCTPPASTAAQCGSCIAPLLSFNQTITQQHTVALHHMQTRAALVFWPLKALHCKHAVAHDRGLYENTVPSAPSCSRGRVQGQSTLQAAARNVPAAAAAAGSQTLEQSAVLLPRPEACKSKHRHMHVRHAASLFIGTGQWQVTCPPPMTICRSTCVPSQKQGWATVLAERLYLLAAAGNSPRLKVHTPTQNRKTG